jgi:hypothetical protein
MEKYLKIKEAADFLGVSALTLRKWDESGKLKPISIDPKNKYRFYSKPQLEKFIEENVFVFAQKWVKKSTAAVLPDFFYCQNTSVFQARLYRLNSDLEKTFGLNGFFSLIVAMAGEIGNNSFDHNLGNWPDMPGIFFGYNLIKKEIVLADRGRGILETLKMARPNLNSDSEALKVAFTEVVSGRAPESRGNGLKFVKKNTENNPISLFFQSGEAELNLAGYNSSLSIKKSLSPFHGCLALIKF